MAELFSVFGGFGGWSSILNILSWLLFFIVFTACIMAIIIMILMKKSSKGFIEINMINRRLRRFNGRMKRHGGKVKQLWIRKIGKYLPDLQQKSTFLQGNKDIYILLKDNNGMHHSARIPTWNELKKFYKVVYNIDLDDKENSSEYQKKIREVYLLPSPHEDLDWLSNQCVEADKEFKVEHWWQSPVVAYAAVGFICFLMIIVTQILNAKL